MQKENVLEVLEQDWSLLLKSNGIEEIQKFGTLERLRIKRRKIMGLLMKIADGTVWLNYSFVRRSGFVPFLSLATQIRFDVSACVRNFFYFHFFRQFVLEQKQD